ncbi:carbohydrate ABC transporter permease [Paenibacillus sp. SI8]|uniref:carbohydrate ABC transporter permease n=1 Tax=unclassified Paenibacillus TaxID=185978 RepID=UPI00346770CE
MRLKYRHQRYVFIYGCLLIPLLFFLLVRILPIFYSFNVSFHEWDLLSETKPYVGFTNFAFVLHDEKFLASLRNTFIYVVLGVPGQLLVGLIVALLLQRITRFRGLFRTIYFIPYVTSIVAVSWVFRWILMPNGAVNSILLQIGLPPQLFLGTPDQAIYVIIGTMIWQAIGFQMLVFLTGLEGIPKLYYEAADIDGAGSWQKFRKITLPLLNSTIVFSVVIASISFLQTFTQVKNMSPGGTGGPLNSTNTLVLYIYQLAFKSYKMGEAAAATVILFAIILVLSLIQLKVLSKKVEY